MKFRVVIDAHVHFVFEETRLRCMHESGDVWNSFRASVLAWSISRPLIAITQPTRDSAGDFAESEQHVIYCHAFFNYFARTTK